MTESEAKVKVGQIFTDEEYESLKKGETKTSEESEGIDWGFGKKEIMCCHLSLSYTESKTNLVSFLLACPTSHFALGVCGLTD